MFALLNYFGAAALLSFTETFLGDKLRITFQGGLGLDLPLRRDWDLRPDLDLPALLLLSLTSLTS